MIIGGEHSCTERGCKRCWKRRQIENEQAESRKHDTTDSEGA